MENLYLSIRGSRWLGFWGELITNTIHFPVVLILLELIPEGLLGFFTTDIGFYALLSASLVQAYFLSAWRYAGREREMVGNLIAPAIYSLFEVALEGPVFFAEPRHLAYWGYALAIGALQQLRHSVGEKLGLALVIVENVVRTTMLLMGYWIFEAGTHPEDALLAGFLADDSHVFISLAILFIGLLIGIANATTLSYQSTLRRTAERLRLYSEYLLGGELLGQAMTDPEALALQRRERAVLFIDIRGFTRWSESQTPEKVVGMLNAYFEAGEQVWARFRAVKSKPSGDEIMVVFPSAQEALQAGLELRSQAQNLLSPYGLAAGIGIHAGPLVEGLVGSKQVKGYDVIGDVVNTAKRICDSAGGGEVLISEAARQAIDGPLNVIETRQVAAKGKELPVSVYLIG